MPAKIFVSHSSLDKPLARRIAFHLRKLGYEPWVDESEIALGTRFPGALASAIRSADAMVLIGTTASSNSEWVRKEFRIASGKAPWERRKLILPIFGDPPLETDPWARLHGLKCRSLYEFAQLLSELKEVLPPPKSQASRIDDRELDDIQNAVSAHELGRLTRWYPQFSQLTVTRREQVEPAVRWFQMLIEIDAPTHAREHFIDATYGCSFGNAAHSSGFNSADHLNQYAFIYGFTGLGFSCLKSALSMPAEPEETDLCNAQWDDGFGRAVSRPAIDPAHAKATIELFRASRRPIYGALYEFVRQSESLLTETEYRDLGNILARWERGPGHMACDAAFELLLRCPDHGPLRRAWIQWVEKGRFEDLNKNGSSRTLLLALLSRAEDADFKGFDFGRDALDKRLRLLMRSSNPQHVLKAFEYCLDAMFKLNSWRRFVSALHDHMASSEWHSHNWPEEVERPLQVYFWQAIRGDKAVKEYYDAVAALDKFIVASSETTSLAARPTNDT